MRIFPGYIEGVVEATPSKSHTHRAVFLAAMADGVSEIRSPLLSADTLASCEAMRLFGAKVEERKNRLVIDGGGLKAPGGWVNAGNSGTTLRLLAGLSALFPKTTVIDGDESLRTRPMKPLLDALIILGADCSSENGRPPVCIHGPVNGTRTRISGGVSSQFISSLLMAGGFRRGSTHIDIEGNVSSRPYVDITLRMMRLFGSKVEETPQGFVTSGGGYRPYDYTVPGDFSSAAFPLVAGAIRGNVTVTGLDLKDLQGDRAIIDILREFGADVEIGDRSVTSRRAPLKAADVDLGNTPDLFPAVCVLAANAQGISRLYNARHLKFKESDRIATTVAMLKAMGADITATEDGCIVRGGRPLHGATIETHGDHRIMMAAFVAALNAETPSTIPLKGEHRVSYPSFLEHMESMSAMMELSEDELDWK